MSQHPTGQQHHLPACPTGQGQARSLPLASVHQLPPSLPQQPAHQQPQPQPQQQPARRMKSPFLAAQPCGDGGALDSFAAHVLAALERCQQRPAAGQQHQHHKQRAGLQAQRAATAAAAGGGGGPSILAVRGAADVQDTGGADNASCTLAGSLGDAGMDSDAVRSLLESCLEEAAERARSETAQSSGLLILGTDSSSLESSCSTAGTAPTITSSSVSLDW